jgi:protein-L-isoaspartate(D-aspartate) O-methyltransferase
MTFFLAGLAVLGVAVAGILNVTADDQAADRAAERARMVDTQIRGRGVTDARVLAAMRTVPRHAFVPAEQQARAYDDTPLPIGFGQTISQPYIVAFMTETLEPKASDRVLEIGTGSGYQAAVLAELVREVYTIEIVEGLAESAKAALQARGYKNVHARRGNGYLGWPEAAPFTKIIVTAAPEQIPAALIEQLAVGGLMVVPVGRQDFMGQQLTLIRKTAKGVVSREILPVRFVPMVDGPR